jgi:hypothetical protein
VNLFPTLTPERCDQLIREARLRRVAREAARADWFSAQQRMIAKNISLAGSGIGAGRSEKRAAEAGEETISSE